MKLSRLSIVLVAVHPLVATAQPASEPSEPSEPSETRSLSSLDEPSVVVKPGSSQLQNVFRLLEEEADVKSVVATKVAQRSVEAPAVVEVITANQLMAAGYLSVAEALGRVPGLAVNTDYVFDNVGVRGTSGGLRSGARHIKVLIDGQPIAFRPDAQNFLGPELIPMSAIERIEVLRGPASALYGLNAFLGVINIVTKRATVGSSGEYSITGLAERYPRYGGAAEAFGMDRIGDVSFMISAHGSYDDRSGLTLPPSGPNYADYDPNAKSQKDISRPISGYGAVEYAASSAGTFTLTSNYQRKDAKGEYADYGAFSHSTRINLDNWFMRLGHNIAFAPVRLTTYAAYSSGHPLANDVIQPMSGGNALTYHVTRDFGYSAVDLGTQATIDLFDNSILLVGTEGTYDREKIRTNTFISNVTNAEIEGGKPPIEPFTNAAGYAQGLFRELGWLQLSGNIRYDYNNQFGSNINYRGGLVLAPTEELHIKLLSGSSYRGPTPEQLFGRPVAPGDVIGSLAASDPEALKPQTARIQEAAINYDYTEENTTLRTQVSSFYTQIYDRIEFLRESEQYRPRNTAQSTTVGGELSVSLLQNRIADFLSVSLSGSVSYQETTIDLNEGTLTDREVERLKINELFPTWMYKAQLLLQVPSWYLRLYGEINAYSERFQSQINQTYNRPFVGLPAYTIAPSYPVDVALSTVGLRLISAETFVQLAIKDLLNTESEQPGFVGINLPPLGRRFLLVIKQDF